jgi:hypothetical protein
MRTTLPCRVYPTKGQVTTLSWQLKQRRDLQNARRQARRAAHRRVGKSLSYCDPQTELPDARTASAEYQTTPRRRERHRDRQHSDRRLSGSALRPAHAAASGSAQPHRRRHGPRSAHCPLRGRPCIVGRRVGGSEPGRGAGLGPGPPAALKEPGWRPGSARLSGPRPPWRRPPPPGPTTLRRCGRTARARPPRRRAARQGPKAERSWGSCT